MNSQSTRATNGSCPVAVLTLASNTPLLAVYDTGGSAIGHHAATAVVASVCVEFVQTVVKVAG